MELRKATFRLYPDAAQSGRLAELLGLHQRLYNTALEQRIKAYQESGKSLGYNSQAKTLTEWRSYCPALAGVNAQSQQNTLKRLDLAYASFFRRVKAGETPGFPRFKSIDRSPGWGYKTHGDGQTHSVANPRFLDKAQRQKLKGLQQAVSRKPDKRSNNRRKAVARLSAESRRIAKRRQDFLHKTSADLVERYGLIATEALNVKNMTASGGEYKKGLNRSILDTAPSTFLNLLKTKAEEAGSLWVEVPTRWVKPSQTCHRCGVQRKKTLAERGHRCDCGASCSRDENAARVMLNWALFGNATGQESGRGGESLRVGDVEPRNSTYTALAA